MKAPLRRRLKLDDTSTPQIAGKTFGDDLLRPRHHSPHMRVLVTGATGFVGSKLLPRLAAEGHELHALARDPAKLDAANVTVTRGDVVTGEGLAQALAGVEVAYYLVHSMERPGGNVSSVERPGGNVHSMARPREERGSRARWSESFAQRERVGALRFADAAVAAKVRRIVYLGGPLPDAAAGPGSGSNDTGAGRVSSHLRSRADVERILLEAIPRSVALRASIVIGARSRSFRLLVRLVERMPVLTMPAWRKHRTQPVDERDVIEMLLAAASSAEVSGRSLDAAGPEALTYEAILQRIAELMLVGRPTVPLRINATPIAARLTAAIVGEDPDLVLPLMESLAGDLLPRKESAAKALHVPLHSFDAAVEHALREWETTEPLAAR